MTPRLRHCDPPHPIGLLEILALEVVVRIELLRSLWMIKAEGVTSMARANKNTLHRSGIEAARQQRRELPNVQGATGAPDDDSPKAAEIKARKRRGKTEKNTSEDTAIS
jgi:hypothetical protein